MLCRWERRYSISRARSWVCCWEALKLVAGVEEEVREWWLRLREGFGVVLRVVLLGVARLETVSMAIVRVKYQRLGFFFF